MRAVAEADRLFRPDGADHAALAAARHGLVRRIGPLFLDSFAFHGIASTDGLLRAVERMRVFYRGTRRTLPGDLPKNPVGRSPGTVIVIKRIDREQCRIAYEQRKRRSQATALRGCGA